MLASISSAVLFGAEGHRVTVEVLPGAGAVEVAENNVTEDEFHIGPATPNLMFCADLFVMTPQGAILARPASDVRAGEERWVARGLAESLARSGFLEDDELDRRRAARHRAFAEAPRREASHSGAAYPADPGELAATLDECFHDANGGSNGFVVV